MKIAVIGLGYQGLVVSTCLAENGHQIIGVGTSETEIDRLRKGEVAIHEPGLGELLARNIEEERLRFTTSIAEAVQSSMMVFICIDTPLGERGALDTSEIEEATRQIAHAMPEYRIVVLKTTCPPGTADNLEAILKQESKHNFDVVVNPDFMKEGAAVDDFMRPDRVVVGCEEVRVREIMKELYTPFLRTGKPVLVMNRRSAEMCKLAVNVMLASRISVMNALADLCAAYGADVSEVREGVAFDERIGPKYLFPGLGFGGAGMPKDLAQCEQMAQEKGINPDIYQAILEVNKSRIGNFTRQILKHFGGELSGKKITVWGASYKPKTDDLRNSPAILIIDTLLAAGAQVMVFDPVSLPKLKAHYGDKIQASSKYYQALEGADALVIATEWNEFRRPDYERMAGAMRQKIIFDGRNLYTPSVMKEHGFTYVSVGRPVAQPE